MNAQDYHQEDTVSRYVVGIDLGTTNSAVCFVDTEQQPWQVQRFGIRQLVAAGQVDTCDTLPSFHFQPLGSETDRPALRLPWQSQPPGYVVGTMAREEGQSAPGRLIVSAKSWLCHAGVDRTAELLPWHAAADVDRLSPIQASARYLQHVREAWDADRPQEPLAEQDVVLTLPASFDEVAREMTVQAAALAGLPRVILIEEPQAAFYAWVYKHRESWESLVAPGQKILICDVGGGTSDFTLIRVRRSEATADPAATAAIQFHRVAVGEHLILGGDNLDLALARHLEQRPGGPAALEPRQWDVLVRSCRQAKETLLGDNPPPHWTVTLPGSGSRLVGGSLSLPVTCQEAQQVLIEGFFPQVDLDEQPQKVQSGFQEFGLPYAPDPAVTRYLAAFLTAHRNADAEVDAARAHHDPARPDLVLLNGGVFASPAIRDRLLETISGWFRRQPDDSWQPTLLANDRLDLAVARGAAYYGMVRRGEGVRIAAELARSYYVAVGTNAPETSPTAVCVVPGSALPGQSIEVEKPLFDLRISEPVEFPLHVSSTRLTDQPGQVVTIDPEQMRPLSPLRTALQARRRSQQGTVPVRLHAHLSEIGTMELWCTQIDGDRRWRLQFDVRAATQTDRVAAVTTGESQGVLDEAVWDATAEQIEQTFAPAGKLPPGQLVKRLMEATATDRSAWPMSFLRRIWETLMEHEAGRRRSAQHEARWLNLLGYALRPGYGLSVDDWRVTETWRIVHGRIAHPSPSCRTESWILWRRIAGGLPAGQQRALAEPLLAAVRALHRRLTGGGTKGETHFAISEFAELWRLLGSLELLTLRTKTDLGQMLVDLLGKRKMQPVRPALWWTIGRLGSRIPVYGPLNTVVDTQPATKWLETLMQHETDDSNQSFALMQLSRYTGDRYRDVSESTRRKITEWLRRHAAPTHLSELVQHGGTLDQEEQQRAFGESLPMGLQIR